MSSKKKAPANKGGRPPRVKGEKLQRINLSLRPSVLFGLEVIARDRSTSLSEAAEYAVAALLRDYDVDIGDDTTIKAQRIVDALENTEVMGELRMALGQTSAAQEKTRAAIKIITAMPRRLRTKQEQFVLECLSVLGEVNRTGKVSLDDAADMISLAKDGFRTGARSSEVLEMFNQLVAARGS